MAKIDNRKDILLLLLYMPGSDGELAKPIRGRTRLMKLLYLLMREKEIDKIFNITNYYEYEAYDYGPFSKDVFEDVQFLRNIDFLEANPEEKTNPIEQWEDYKLVIESGVDYENEGVDPEFQEEEFSLSDKGKRFVEENLLPILPDEAKEDLQSIKIFGGDMSLSSLLRYVYIKYPESASKARLTHLTS